MRYQIVFSSGFVKLAKIKLESGVIDTPTIMRRNNLKDEDNHWIIGDKKVKITMDYPTGYLVKNNKQTSDTDLVIIENFLMHPVLDKKILEKKLAQAVEQVKKKIFEVTPERAVCVIQPTESKETLFKFLEAIVELKIENIAITNLLPILTNHRKLVEFFGLVKTTVPIGTKILILSPVPHIFIPLLAYLGADIFSNDFPILSTKQKVFLTHSGGDEIQNLKEKICFCEACSSVSEVKEMVSFDKLLHHNEHIFLQKIRETREALHKKDLRSFLEKELQNHPTIASAIRIMDEIWKDEIIIRTPTWSSYSIKSITSYGFTRPEIIAFQEKMLERFSILKNKKIIVLLPCSARKPYSDSRSHKLFLDAISSIPANKWGYVQELILTSPLGVIPRELERVFPAAHYDIPVTGDWSFEEKEIAITQLVAILTKLPHKDFTIVAHVSGEYVELCQEAEKRLKMKFVYTALENKATSPIALGALSNKLQSLVNDLPVIHYYPDQELLHALTDYHFGKDIGKTLFTKCKIKGKPPLPFKILQGNDQIGVIQPASGKLILSMKTGEILAKRKVYFVISNAEKLEGSTLFAVGVVKADEKIRPSDEVVILSEKGELLGIGTAQMSGIDMNKQKKGSVVKIRAKK
ncbi:MAG: DUF5591 domain-containing protein [Candidatus Heimdallarchaeota archaeon]